MTAVNVGWTMVFFRFLGEAAHHDDHDGAAHDDGGNSQIGSIWVNRSINLSIFSMLVASSGGLVRQMEARH